MSTRLKSLAYYKTGGEVKKFLEPKSLSDLQGAIKEIKAEHLDSFFLGAGSNSLVSDEFWPGAVIVFKKMRRLEIIDSGRIAAGAGISNSEFSEFTLAHRLSGASWMNRLPGQLGGTVRMNARCYGGEISEIVDEVISVDNEGNLHHTKAKDAFRGYKDTIFMNNKHAIAEIITKPLPLGDSEEIRKHMNFCEQDRVSKGQFNFPTCGCIFKNNYNVGVPSGMLLEAAGVKNLKFSNLSINPFHANFLYNQGATSKEILAASVKMRELVYQEFGVWLDYEMEYLGKLPEEYVSIFTEVRVSRPNSEKIGPLKEKFKRK